MSLPTIRSLADCTDFETSVLPYVSQLYDLPQNIYQSISDLQALKQIYIGTNPLVFALAFSLFLVPFFLFVSEVNKNYSQVDRVWSILPTIYNAHFTVYVHAVGLPTGRLDTLLFISALWSVRLTYNYWRKGGYSIGSEDYRWEVLRKHISPPLFFILNVIFISLSQSLLLFFITTPTYIMVLAATKSEDSYTNADLIYSSTLGCLVFLAFYADQQQWNYQTAKKSYQDSAKVPAGYHQVDLDRGFNVCGIFSWSRHPNFAAEQAFWVAMYAWASWITQTYINWTAIGPILYLLLFQASTWFTELISMKKYSEYDEYRQRVGKFLPNLLNFRNAGPGDFSDKKAPKAITDE